MTDLLTRLESGSGADAALEVALCERLGIPWPYKPILTSLDAALSLVERMLPKCGVNIDIAPDGQETVCVHIQQSEAEWTYHGWPAEFAKTAPRAVLKALLRTLETREKDRAKLKEPQQ